MADPWSDLMTFLQAPYQRRLDAGQVVTPGPVDWGGLRNGIQAPYLSKSQDVDPMWAEQGKTGAAVQPINMRGSNIVPRMAVLKTPPSNMRGDDRSIRMAALQPPKVNGNGLVAGLNTSRLPATNVRLGYGPETDSGVPALTAINGATKPAFGSGPFTQPYTAKFRPASLLPQTHNDIQLQFEPGDVSGQRFADSEGRTFRTPSGKVYSPSGGAGAAPVLGGSPQDMRGREPARPGGMLGGSLLSFLTPKAVAPRTSAGVPIAAASGVRGPGNAIYASGGRSYGSDPGQVTIGLKPGERTYDPVSNSWGLKTR